DSLAAMCGSGTVESTPAHSGPTTPKRAIAWPRKEPRGSTPKVAHVRQPRTTVVNPACGCSRDRNEEQDSGLRRSSVERNKEGDGFVRFRWGETKEQDAFGGARLTIEIGADFRFSRTLDEASASTARGERESRGKRGARLGLPAPIHQKCGR